MAASRPFDLLLIDLQLPDTGTDVIRSVRGASAAPFILISGFLSTENHGGCDEIGRDRCRGKTDFRGRTASARCHIGEIYSDRNASNMPPRTAARVATTARQQARSKDRGDSEPALRHTLSCKAATKRSTSGASRPAWIEKSPPRPTIAHRLGIADGRSAAAGDRYLPDGRVAACPAQATRLSRASESDKNVGWPPLPTSTGVRQA